MTSLKGLIFLAIFLLLLIPVVSSITLGQPNIKGIILGLKNAAYNIIQANTIQQPSKTVTAVSYNMSMNDYFILADATNNNIQIGLPPCTLDGKEILIKRIDGSLVNTFTIIPLGTNTIEGASSILATTQFATRQLICQGGTWYKISSLLS